MVDYDEKGTRLRKIRGSQEMARWPFRGMYAFLPGGDAFLSGDGGTLRLVSLEPKRPPRILASSLSWIRRVVTSKDGRYVATGHGNAGNNPPNANDDCSVRLWDMNSTQLLKRFDGFKHSVWGLAFTPDSKRLFAVSLDGSIHLFDVVSLKEIWRKDGLASLYDIAVSRDGQFVLTGGADGQVRLWRVKSGVQ